MRIARTLTLSSLILTLTIPTMGGCRWWRSHRPDGLSTPASDFLPIKGEEVTAARRTAIDIENPNGSVTVVVSDRYKRAYVYARAAWRSQYTKAEWEEVRNEDWVVAEHVIEDGNSILRILSQATPDVDPPVHTDIRVLMPACDGVFIRNANGNVKVIGAGGAHTIESGFDFGPGGNIDVKTSRDISDPITLRTSDGFIDLTLDDGSEGTLDLKTEDGTAFFSSKYGRTTNVQAETGHWRGVWHASTNPITLQTLRGNVRVSVVDDPEQHTSGLRTSWYP